MACCGVVAMMPSLSPPRLDTFGRCRYASRYTQIGTDQPGFASKGTRFGIKGTGFGGEGTGFGSKGTGFGSKGMGFGSKVEAYSRKTCQSHAAPNRKNVRTNGNIGMISSR